MVILNIARTLTPSNNFSSPRWYQTWWGVMLAGAMVAVGLGLGALLVLTGRYWWQIRSGRGAEIEAALARQFTLVRREAAKPAGAVTRSELETADDPFLGALNAPVVIVEFVDFKCPNCRAAAPIMERLVGLYPGQVKLIIRDFPAESLHPGATELSYLANCAAAQSRFWPLQNLLYAEQDSLPDSLAPSALLELARRVDLDAAKLTACLASPDTKREIQQDFVTGVSAGVRGTPTFFVNGQKVEGVVPLEAWQKYVEAKLAK